MDNALISVIVPVYNVEEYIYECVDSILAQTYTNLEIILVDDGSPDRCGEICEEYAQLDARVKVIHKKNGGLSDARNAGLDLAKGEYIAFVDSDDYILPTFIATLSENLIKHNADISIVGAFRNLKALRASHAGNRVTFYDSYLTFLYDKTIQDGKIEVWRKLYKKEIWSSLRFPFGKKSEDTFVYPYVVYNRKIVYADSKLYYYRVNPKSIMESFDDSVALDANEAFTGNIEFFNKVWPDYVTRIKEEQVGFNYAYYLRCKTYNSVCRDFLIKNMNLMFKYFPFKTGVKLYLIIFIRMLLGKR